MRLEKVPPYPDRVQHIVTKARRRGSFDHRHLLGGQGLHKPRVVDVLRDLPFPLARLDAEVRRRSEGLGEDPDHARELDEVVGIPLRRSRSVDLRDLRDEVVGPVVVEREHVETHPCPGAVALLHGIPEVVDMDEATVLGPPRDPATTESGVEGDKVGRHHFTRMGMTTAHDVCVRDDRR